MLKTKAVIDTSLNENLILDEVVIDDPKPYELVIKLYASGICGSQLINLHHPKIQRPQLLGHEATGVIIQAGRKIDTFKEGDDVLISWIPVNANEETDYLKWANVNWNGKKLNSILFTWAEHTVLDQQFVSPLPKDIERHSASIIGCAIATGSGSVNNIGNVSPGNSVAVFGAGGLGLASINAAKIIGAYPIIAVDIDDNKLELAKKIGASHIINSNKSDPVKIINNITNGGADYVYDMVGVPSVLEQTINSAKQGILGYSQGGMVILGGFPHDSRDFNPRDLINGQRSYVGSKGGFTKPDIDFPKYFELSKNNELPLEKIVTNRYKLDDINLAVEDLINGKILGRGILEIS